MEFILHHYDYSSFSEKVRLIFGFKRLAWRSVEIPAYGPKPDYTPLTAGYRRTPALQIGADIYCDTRLIAAEIERRVPLPSIYPSGEAARALLEVLIAWAENQLFRPLAVAVTGEHATRFSAAFHADRAGLHGKPAPTLDQVRAAARHARAQFELQMVWLEGLFNDPRPYLLGSCVSLADFALYAAPWFLEIIGGRSELLESLPRTRAWMARVAAVGHGHPAPMTAQGALEIAAASTPRPCNTTNCGALAGIALGDKVTVAPVDQRASAHGTLASIDRESVTLAHGHRDVGELAVHFPRLGYRFSRALT